MADRRRWPLLVRVALWGVPTRAAAWFYVALSLALAVGGVAAGAAYDARAYLGAMMALAALWYYLAIRWVDGNGGWS